MKINVNVWGLLLLILVTLKALGLTPISWFWATSPLWIPIGLVASGLILFGIAIVICAVCEVVVERRKK